MLLPTRSTTCRSIKSRCVLNHECTSLGEGVQLERENYFFVYANEVPNGRPVFFCRNANNYPFLSSQTDCGVGRAPLLTLGFWVPEPACGASPLYHLSHPNGDFFYTISAGERDNAVSAYGYADQGIVGYIWTESQ